MTSASIVPAAGQRCIVVDDLRLSFFIGVHEREKLAQQEVSITVYMFIADAGVPSSDDIRDHVSYADLVDRLIERAATKRHVNLVETLAEEVATLALADARVLRAIVDVRKTEIIAQAKGVGVIIHRRRGAGTVDGG
ncbi:MAG TPA: dihydroneopterin aldolase [Hyphomicrobiaceae bacterium]|nr:dihydroneopterin aldolase [Hyphomicrobiaceae bacterium]